MVSETTVLRCSNEASKSTCEWIVVRCVLPMLLGGVQVRRLCLRGHPVHFRPDRSARLHVLLTPVKRCGEMTYCSAQSLQAEMQHLCEAITAYADKTPSVTGTERLLKRAERDRLYVQSLLGTAGRAKSAAFPESEPTLNPLDLQGVRNNLRGLQAELDVAWQAEAVVCLGAKFYSHVSAGVFCFENVIVRSMAMIICSPI